jgi:DNA-binding response OmpR family regulator
MRAAGKKKKARSAGCANYVLKPFSPPQLLAKISLALIAAVHESQFGPKRTSMSR